MTDRITNVPGQAPEGSPAKFTYSPWRHGGWYVHGVTYPSGAIGCVSRNYADRKWRIACDPRPFDEQPTFKSRDEAARAEWELVAAYAKTPKGIAEAAEEARRNADAEAHNARGAADAANAADLERGLAVQRVQEQIAAVSPEPGSYEARVQAYEAEGMSRSDAQGVVDAEDLQLNGATEEQLLETADKVVLLGNWFAILGGELVSGPMNADGSMDFEGCCAVDWFRIDPCNRPMCERALAMLCGPALRDCLNDAVGTEEGNYKEPHNPDDSSNCDTEPEWMFNARNALADASGPEEVCLQRGGLSHG